MGKSLEAALTAMKKRFGETSVFKGDEKVMVEVETISSGSLALDAALLVGGYPRGRLIELSGPEAGGKSFLSLMAIKKAQEQGLTCVFIDGEHTLDRAWCTKLGIDVDKLIIAHPDFLEDALNQMILFAKTGEVGLIVLDSVPALPTKAESNKEIGEATIGGHAKILSNALRQMTPLFHQKQVTGIFINQLREKIGVMFGNPETTPGGRALKHHCSVRIGVTKVGNTDIKDDFGRIIGHTIRARVKKNKVSTAQGLTVEFIIKYTEGIDRLDEIQTVGLQCGVITKPNNKTYVVGDQKFIGQQALSNFLAENPKVATEVEQKIMTAMRDGVKTTTIEPEEDDGGDSEGISVKDNGEEFLSLKE
jgi:recombination protein RecA